MSSVRLGSALRAYQRRLSAFRPNARLYLVSTVLSGMAMGIYQLLFNFYILSLGFDSGFLGSLLTTSSLTVLVLAIPMGFFCDRLGNKLALLSGLALEASALLVMSRWPYVPVLYAMCLVLGAGQCLNGVAFGPFLMENSGEGERTYLFSFASGFNTASSSLGNCLGGLLPGWIALWIGTEYGSSTAYGSSLTIVALCYIIAALPLVFVTSTRQVHTRESAFAPFNYMANHPSLLSKLVAPMLVTSIGAGMIMPFMNVFFRTVYNQSDAAIGALFAWGSLAMGIGLMIAPPLSERIGKIQLVVITQAISIPFLCLLGFSPWYWLSAASYYIRLTLMNMSGPIYQAYVMEKVEPSARGMVASLVSMSSNFGWAFTPSISGWIQERYSFGPAFICTILMYTLSTLLYWGYFWRGAEKPHPDSLRFRI